MDILMINKLFKNHYFLISIQFVVLLVFILLIYGAIGITTDDKDFALILRNTNFSNLIVWSYWWPLIIVTAILFGRFWCSICPMELITSFFGKIGFRKKPNKLPFVFYMILAILKKVIAKETWIKSFTQLVIAILPVTASMHLLKSLLKTTSRIPYWDFVFSDPKGVKTAQLLTDNSTLIINSPVS